MFRVTNDAARDLRELRGYAPAVAARIVALIQQLKADAALRNLLHERNYGEDKSGPIGVKWWVTMRQDTGKPVSRLRAFDLEDDGIDFRLLYLYDVSDRSFNLLAVVHKDVLDYDNPDNPLRRRVLQTIQRDFPDA